MNEAETKAAILALVKAYPDRCIWILEELAAGRSIKSVEDELNKSHEPS